MGQTFDQMKTLNQLRKAQKALKNEIVEVEAGDGVLIIGTFYFPKDNAKI